MINVGVVGSGFIVPVFIGCSKKIKDYHLRAIWGRHEAKLQNFKEEFDYCTTDLEKILSDEKIDVIYIALPNALHYEYALKALKHGKHVILEKPFTVFYKDAKKLIDYAKKHGLIIFEAITTQHNPNYHKAKKLVKELGDIRIVMCNFSQYSRRYDRFKKGEILPVFDQKLAGGALLDLNVYNIHYVTGIFGMPKDVQYFANIERGVDTSGVLILDYGTFKATLIAAKDCKCECYGLIEGDNGYLRNNTTCSRCADFTLRLNSGKEQRFEQKDKDEFGSWSHELKEFARMYKNKDYTKAEEYNRQTLTVARVLDKAIVSADLKYQEEK
ncbi:MAG: Gfo/Idh/MocA family oxidoreductase [Erysipelotrichaceae bacterium]|nr:Gfo/Idh/MocA family oxidoreductase [Erysipelotrichaceae bacterium]